MGHLIQRQSEDSLPSLGCCRRTILVVSLGFLTHKLAKHLHLFLHPQGNESVLLTSFAYMARSAPAGEPTCLTHFSQGLGDSQPWQVLKTLLPLGFNNSVKDLVLRNSWGKGRPQRAKSRKCPPVWEAQEPESPAGAFQPVTHGATSLLNPAWTPASRSLCLSASSCLHSAQTLEQSRSLESTAKTEVLCIYWASSVEAAILKTKKVTSLPSEELEELKWSVLTIWDWNLVITSWKKKGRHSTVHSFSLIHNRRHLLSAYYVPGTVLSTLYPLLFLILTITLWGMYHY